MTRNDIISEHYIVNFDKLVKRAKWRVPNHSLYLAEEVVQEAYTRALKFFKAYSPERGDFGAWFNRIYNGCVADCIKSENGNLPSFDNIDENLEPFIIDNNAWVPKDMAIRIKEGIEAQKPEVAEVLNMFFLMGMKASDIAECTNQSHANVRQMIYRFRVKWSDENIF